MKRAANYNTNFMVWYPYGLASDLLACLKCWLHFYEQSNFPKLISRISIFQGKWQHNKSSTSYRRYVCPGEKERGESAKTTPQLQQSSQHLKSMQIIVGFKQFLSFDSLGFCGKRGLTRWWEVTSILINATVCYFNHQWSPRPGF